jgi:hypothetical protein
MAGLGETVQPVEADLAEMLQLRLAPNKGSHQQLRCRMQPKEKPRRPTRLKLSSPELERAEGSTGG